MKAYRFLLILTGLALMIFSCSDKSEPEPVNIQFKLTDMPGEYQQVNIDVVAVHIILNDSLIELNTNRGIYNLLEFVNGRDTLLVDDELPSGFISQVRLVLGENNSIMVDSVLNNLKTPSAQQSGLKLNLHEEFFEGESYAYVIDFDASKSVVKTGNDKYILKPVIRVFTEAVTGSIQGIIQPVEARPLILAILNSDTVGSARADTVSGEFMVRGLPEGAFSLKFDPVEGYKDTLINNIGVTAGQSTVLDTVILH
jgi:hypothetical protein